MRKEPLWVEFVPNKRDSRETQRLPSPFCHVRIWDVWDQKIVTTWPYWRLDPRPLASRAGEIDFYCLLATWSIVFLMVAWMDSDDIFVKTQARVPVAWVGINEWKILDSITSKSPLPADPDPLIIEASLITLTLSSLRLLRLIYKIYVSS